MFQRILVPLDGSELAVAAIPYAALLPASSVRLLTVAASPGSDETQAVNHADSVRRARDPLAAAGLVVDHDIVYGDPAEEIVRAAAAADLIVMTTSGQGAGGRLLFGSVADRVARHAPVPTLLVRGGDDPIDPSPVSRIVVPLDGSPTAARALHFAEGLARIFGTSIHCLSVADVEPGSASVSSRLPTPVYAAALEAARQQAEEIVSQAASTCQQSGLATSTEIRQGSARGELIAALRPGDLVVMTTHGHGRASRWSIGTVAEGVLRRSPGPVLLIRADTSATPERG